MSDPKPQKRPKIRLVKFTAEWCYPCKVMEPTLTEFAKAHPEVKIERVDIDTKRGGKRADALNVKSIPYMILYRGTEVVWQRGEVVSLKTLEAAYKRATEPEKGA